VVRDPASRGAGDRNEVRDRALSLEQRLEHVETRRIPEDPKVPRSRSQGRCRRRGITQVSDRSHGLTYNRFSC
jgi:hypothetical protein